MLKKLFRFFRSNPLDQIIKKAAKEQKKKFLIEWNRGLGDIPLGLYAVVHRIREAISDAEITFLTRRDLEDGFSFLENTKTIVAPFWKRHESYDATDALKQLNIDPNHYDVLLKKVDPTYWVRWQLSNLVPKLQWLDVYDNIWKKFSIDPKKKYISMQPQVETNYNFHRNWPLDRWQSLIEKLQKEKRASIILVGTRDEPKFSGKKILDLRGKTNLFEVLSILKNCSSHFVTPDSGLLAFIYYLNAKFPLDVVSLWSDPRQGILKQNVASPNPLLNHFPMIGEFKNLSTLKVDQVSALCKKS